MDFFQEARWFMDEEDRVTWYQDVVRKLVIAPRLPRFGIMQNFCSSLVLPSGRTECDETILHRVLGGEPKLLLADIGNLENNHPCKQCIEEQYEAIMSQFLQRTQMVFGGIYDLALKYGQNDLGAQCLNILEKLDQQAVVDFFSYYVARSLYVELGAEIYMENRDKFSTAISGCKAPGSLLDCPEPTTKDEAKKDLANHADHAFSSSVTSGNPLPVWGNDGEGYLLQGTSPVGGSGIDLSGTPFSSLAYLAAPTGGDWEGLVEKDPIYAWFIASETPMSARKLVSFEIGNYASTLF